MAGSKKTKAELLSEIETFRARVAELEKSLDEHKRANERLLKRFSQIEQTASARTGELMMLNHQLKLETVSRKHAEKGAMKTIADLRAALEELRATQEQLRRQNEELNAARQAEEAERKRYRELFHSALDGCLMTDTAGNIREANRSAAALFGVPCEFLLNKKLALFWAGKNRRDLHARLNELKLTNQLVRWETVICPKEGDPFNAMINVAVVRDPQDNPIGLHWSIRDISREKRAEEAMVREARINASLAHLSKSFIQSASIENISSLVLEYAMRLTGSSHGYAGFIDQRSGNLVVPTLTEQVGESCNVSAKTTVFKESKGLWGWGLVNRKPLLTNAPFEDPRRAGFPKGHIPIHRFLSVPALAGETLIGQIAVANPDRDYNEADCELLERLAALYALAIQRERTEEALRESEERFRMAVDSYPAVFVIYDSNMRVQFVNSRGVNIIGRPEQDIIGHTDEEFVPSSVTERYLPTMHRALKARTPQSSEFSVRLPSGDVTFAVTYVPILDERGEVKQLLGITYDITSHQRLEEALRESEARYRTLSERLEAMVREQVAELRQAESLAAMGQMISAVSHEIRNPLQTIQMGVDAIRTALGEDRDKREILQEIDQGIDLLRSTVSELLEYSKPVQLKRAPRPLREVINQSLTFLSDRLQNITLELKLEHEEKDIVIDPDKITRVLINIISNALDSMHGGGCLGIGSKICESEAGQALELCVSDTGCGIDEEILQRIQEPFFTTKAHGTGLGLSICKKIIDAHGGTLNISSKLKEGTIVEIVLPI